MGLKINDELRSIVPFESVKNYCVSSEDEIEKYKVVPESVFKPFSIPNMKQSIFENGSMPAVAMIYGDFIMGAMDSNKEGGSWAETGGIYVHLDTRPKGCWRISYKTHEGDLYPYKDPVKGNTSIGTHAMVIVGWGVQEVRNFLPNAIPGRDTIELEYWVVRNSWGTNWNGDGYCKIAVTDYELGINTKVKLDAIDTSFGALDFYIAGKEESDDESGSDWSDDSGSDSFSVNVADMSPVDALPVRVSRVGWSNMRGGNEGDMMWNVVICFFIIVLCVLAFAYKHWKG